MRKRMKKHLAYLIPFMSSAALGWSMLPCTAGVQAAEQEEAAAFNGDWADYYAYLSQPSVCGGIADTQICYENGDEGQTAVLKDEGQGFFGYCVRDFDMDGYMELFAIGSWYLGAESGRTAVEGYIYDDVNGEIQSTRMFSIEYAGFEDITECLLQGRIQAEAVRSEGESWYVIFRETGCYADNGKAFEKSGAFLYDGDSQSCISAGDHIAFYSEKYLEAEHVPVGRLEMRNHYQDEVLTDGEISFMSAEGNFTAENSLDEAAGMKASFYAAGHFSGDSEADEEFACYWYYKYEDRDLARDAAQIWYAKNGEARQLFCWETPVYCNLFAPIVYESEEKQYFIINSERKNALPWSEVMIFGADKEGEFGEICSFSGWIEQNEDGTLFVEKEYREYGGFWIHAVICRYEAVISEGALIPTAVLSEKKVTPADLVNKLAADMSAEEASGILMKCGPVSIMDQSLYLWNDGIIYQISRAADSENSAVLWELTDSFSIDETMEEQYRLIEKYLSELGEELFRQ